MAEPASVRPRGFTGSTALAGSGLLVLGLSASVYLVVSARMVGPEHFSEIAVLWTLVYTLGIGLFLPFEQEVSRTATLSLAAGRRLSPLLRHSGSQAAVVLGVLAATVVVAMGFDQLRTALLADSWWFALALVTAAGGLAVQYLQRGVFAATGRFAAYGGQQGAEGIFRIIACVALALAHVHAPLAYAAVLALSPWLSAVLVLPALDLRARGPATVSVSAAAPTPSSARRGDRNLLGWLICATLASQGLANLAAPAVRLMSSPSQQEAAGNFLSGLTIARIPLLLFAAVQAVLLPRLVRARHLQDAPGFARQLGAVVGVTAAIGAAAIAGVALIGPWSLRLLFGDQFALPRLDLVLLAASAALLMLALALQSAVVALDGHRWAAIAWTSGVLTFLAALAVPASIFLRAEVAMLAGAACVLGLLSLRIGGDAASGVRGVRDRGRTTQERQN